MLSEIYGRLMMKTPPKKYKSDKNAETKSVEGVDEQDSVWSSKHPPASSSKRSNGTRLCNIIFFVTSKIARLNEQSPNRIRCS